MNEDSILMVNVEQYLLHSRWKRLSKTCLYCLFFMYIGFEDEKKGQQFQLMPLWWLLPWWILQANDCLDKPVWINVLHIFVTEQKSDYGFISFSINKKKAMTYNIKKITFEQYNLNSISFLSFHFGHICGRHVRWRLLFSPLVCPF